MASWDQLGELSNIAQLTGLDAVRLIALIVQAATSARMHRKNCRQLAQHLKLIGNLLDQLKVSELKKYPETREPLDLLEDALRRSFVLVDSCQNRSYLYLLAMGWSIVYQFRRAQSEIDRYLRIVPLITLVDNTRFRERLEYIERDEREYTMDDEDVKVKDALLDRDPSRNHTVVLKKSLSCTYPNLPFDEALQKENEKLQLELQRSQVNMDIGQCEVIQHLIGVTQTVANTLPEKVIHLKNTKEVESNQLDAKNEKGHAYDGVYLSQQSDTRTTSRSISTVSSSHDLISKRGSHRHEKWHSDLLDCCSEPYLSSAGACNDLMAYSLILSCCCYTCCVRRRLRKMFNITGGACDDFLSHLMCCCCALVQEWREVETRGVKGPGKTKTSPPPSQYMES